PDDTEGPGSTAIVPGPYAAVEPGLPMRVTTQRSIPHEPAAVVDHWHPPMHGSSEPASPRVRVGLERVHGLTASPAGAPWVPMVVAVVLLVLAGLGSSWWLMGRDAEWYARPHKVDAPSSVVAVAGRPPASEDDAAV